MSRWENAPSVRQVIRLMRVMVGLHCISYPKPPAAVTLFRGVARSFLPAGP
jgi:hypothetical protein